MSPPIKPTSLVSIHGGPAIVYTAGAAMAVFANSRALFISWDGMQYPAHVPPPGSLSPGPEIMWALLEDEPPQREKTAAMITMAATITAPMMYALSHMARSGEMSIPIMAIIHTKKTRGYLRACSGRTRPPCSASRGRGVRQATPSGGCRTRPPRQPERPQPRNSCRRRRLPRQPY